VLHYLPLLILDEFKVTITQMCLIQNIVWPVTVSAAVGSVVIVAMNVYCQLIMTPSLGFEGVALSIVCMQWTNLVTLIVLIVVRKWWIRKYGDGTASLLSTNPAEASNQNSKYEIINSQDDDISLERDQLASSNSEDSGDIEAKLPASKRTTDKAASISILSEDPEDNFPPITFSVFQEWVQFLKLGIPGAASLFIGTLRHLIASRSSDLWLFVIFALFDFNLVCRVVRTRMFVAYD
jgi:hypothetical protein